MRDKDFCSVLETIYTLFDAIFLADSQQDFRRMAKEPLKKLGGEIEALGGSIPELKEPC